MARRPAISLALVALAAVACGPAPRPRETAPPPLAIPSSTGPRPVAPRIEAPPAAPADLTWLVRVNDPEQLLRDLASLLPAHLAGAVQSISPAELLSSFLGPRLGDAIDLSQPVDIATVGSPDATVVSIAVKADAESKLEGALTLRDEGGLVFVEQGVDGAARDSMRAHACALTASSGRAATRLVCGADESVVKRTAKYLVRTVAAEPFASDASVTLPGRSLRGERSGSGKALGDSAGARLGAELVDRFLGEVDRIDAGLRFAGDGIDVELDLRLSAMQSALSRALVARSPAKPPPRAFYRLPADAIFAMHTTGVAQEEMTPLRAALAENLAGSLTRDGYLPEKVRAIRERIESLVLTGGPLVVGAGVVGGRDGAERALAALAATKSDAKVEAKVEARAREALSPWVLFEVDEPTDRWTGALRDIVRLGAEADRTRTPGSTSSTPRDPDDDHVDVRTASLDKSLRLPADALHLEVLMTPNTKGKGRTPRRAHVFVVRGDERGTTTWVGYGEDAAAIASRLRLAADDTTDAGTLERSVEATSLRGKAAAGAGLVAVPAITYLFAKARTADDLRTAAASASRWSGRSGVPANVPNLPILPSLPNVTVTFTMTAETSRLSLRSHVPRTLARDLLQLVSP